MPTAPGFEFLLPIARWKGFGGEMNSREWSFETLTHAAALGAVTQNIAVFATVHVPMVHPVFAAKALTTIDHVSNGRAGLNIVCGWNPEEFGMFGLELIEERYAQGLEWFEIMNRIYTADAPFDYDGKFYKLKAVSGKPRPMQKPRPITLNAAFSPPGREFAAKAADYLFTTFTEIDKGREHIDDMKKRAAAERPRGRRLHDLPRGVPPDPGRGRGLLRALRGDDGRQGEPRSLREAEADLFGLARRGRLPAAPQALRGRRRDLSAGRHAGLHRRGDGEDRARGLRRHHGVVRQLQERAAVFHRQRVAAAERGGVAH